MDASGRGSGKVSWGNETAGWPGWGKDASAQQCKPPQEERRRCQRSGETKVIVRGRERKGDDREFEDVDILVTRNVFAQIVHAYWMIAVFGMAGVGAAVSFVVVRRRKKQ